MTLWPSRPRHITAGTSSAGPVQVPKPISDGKLGVLQGLRDRGTTPEKSTSRCDPPGRAKDMVNRPVTAERDLNGTLMNDMTSGGP